MKFGLTRYLATIVKAVPRSVMAMENGRNRVDTGLDGRLLSLVEGGRGETTGNDDLPQTDSSVSGKNIVRLTE